MKLLHLYVSLCFILLFSGCGVLINKNKGVIGKTSRQTSAVSSQIQNLNSEKAAVNNAKLTTIGAWSSGVDYSLQQESNQSSAVVTARTLNDRISALANQPNFDELQKIHEIVDTLITNETKGKQLLQQKDKEIFELEKSLKEIEKNKEEQIAKIIKVSASNAAQADQYKATINEMDSFWGFGAIGYGIKKLVTRLAWILGGALVLYFVLRILSHVNPIAATLFSIINTIFSLFVKTIQSIAPKAVHVAGFIEKKDLDDYKGTLTHLVDAIQMMIEKEKLGVDVKIDDLLKEAQQNMDQSDKDRYNQIKKQLNWN